MTDSDTESTIRNVLAAVLDRPLEDVGGATIGLWDSLDWINILFALEEKFDIEFGDNDGQDNLSDINGLVEAVDRRLSARGQG